jgi:hypothetical protein
MQKCPKLKMKLFFLSVIVMLVWASLIKIGPKKSVWMGSNKFVCSASTGHNKCGLAMKTLTWAGPKKIVGSGKIDSVCEKNYN